MKSDKGVVWGLVVLALVVAVIAAGVKFGPFKAEAKVFADFGKILVNFFTLILVALFIERVVEVFTKGWRAPQREALEQSVEAATRIAVGKSPVPTGTPDDVKATLEAAIAAQDSGVKQANKALAEYRSETRRYAFVGATVLGLLAAVAGVRALALFITVPTMAKAADATSPAVTEGQIFIFVAFDVLVTGLLLAGGAEGLHKIVDTFTTWMEQTKKNLKK